MNRRQAIVTMGGTVAALLSPTMTSSVAIPVSSSPVVARGHGLNCEGCRIVYMVLAHNIELMEANAPFAFGFDTGVDGDGGSLTICGGRLEDAEGHRWTLARGASGSSPTAASVDAIIRDARRRWNGHVNKYGQVAWRWSRAARRSHAFGTHAHSPEFLYQKCAECGSRNRPVAERCRSCGSRRWILCGLESNIGLTAELGTYPYRWDENGIQMGPGYRERVLSAMRSV